MKLGLVLGSGSARGWAHIGVINELARYGITPHVVTGSSIGALVGAAVASNRLKDLEEWVLGLDNWQVLGLLDWGLGRGGLISGEKVFEKIADTIGDITFEDLHMPYGAVATDLMSGREAWLTKGKIKDALRSSCAIPGILAPALHEGRWMVDGATVNPIPVTLCRALGADFVIAVDLNSDKSNKIAANQQALLTQNNEPDAQANNVSLEAKMEQLEAASAQTQPLDYHQEHEIAKGPNIFEQLMIHSKEAIQGFKDKQEEKRRTPDLFAVMSGCIDIMQDRITRSRLAGEPPDLLLQPKLAQYGIMEFDRAEELIKEGEKCVQVSKPILEYQLEHMLVRPT
ncbi:MAG: patatin [Alteromonadaceae bacterium]|nr:patatin [Alteromonadaceae bacterium]